MKLAEILQELKSRESFEELTKKRFACANCGATWVEAVGWLMGAKAGKKIFACASVWNLKAVRYAE